MEDGGINLRKYQPRKVSRMYILKVVAYTLVIFGLIWFITKKLEERAARAEELKIEGVRIEN